MRLTGTNYQTQSKYHIIEIYKTANTNTPLHFNTVFSQHG